MRKNDIFHCIMLVLCVVAFVVTLIWASGIPARADEVDENDLYLLSHLIAGEANDSSEIMKEYVGSVVLNRVADSRFPDTLEEVIYQPGQYACTWDGNFEKEPNENTLEVAKDLLENGSIIDASVVWQAEFVQGNGIYDTLTCPVMGTVMYFCY